jgi:hypothetical protein
LFNIISTFPFPYIIKLFRNINLVNQTLNMCYYVGVKRMRERSNNQILP